MLAGTTFILPDLPWAALLAGITRDARPGDMVEVHTQPMHDGAVRRLREAYRDDVTVVVRPPRGGSSGFEAAERSSSACDSREGLTERCCIHDAVDASGEQAANPTCP